MYTKQKHIPGLKTLHRCVKISLFKFLNKIKLEDIFSLNLNFETLNKVDLYTRLYLPGLYVYILSGFNICFVI